MNDQEKELLKQFYNENFKADFLTDFEQLPEYQLEIFKNSIAFNMLRLKKSTKQMGEAFTAYFDKFCKKQS